MGFLDWLILLDFINNLNCHGICVESLVRELRVVGKYEHLLSFPAVGKFDEIYFCNLRLFAVVDDIFCLFQGHIENVAQLKQQYGLNKAANEVIIVIEAYRTLRDRGPYPADQVVRDIQGKFVFILYDSSSKTSFFASDADGSVPFHWGTDSEGQLVLSDDVEIMKKGCGKSFAPFPKGCFFTTSGGLRSYEHPLNELKPVPRVDSSGNVCGANFKVDAEARKESSGMPRVGSAANWSSNY